MREAKANLRAALRRVSIDDADRTTASARITAILLGHELFTTASSIAAFVGTRNEPDTTAILLAAFEQHKHVYLPRVLDRTTLAWHRVHDLHDLRRSAYGLLEPPAESEHQTTFPEVALALVPGLGFSSAGERIGHGRGYYDRTLARVTAHTALVGTTLARFVDPPEGPIPTTATDVPMHAILSERDLTICSPIR